jgi:hypothetical protein
MKAKIKRELKEKKRKERNLHLGRFPLPWPSYPFWPAHLSLIPPAQPTQAPGLVIHSRSAQGEKNQVAPAFPFGGTGLSVIHRLPSWDPHPSCVFILITANRFSPSLVFVAILRVRPKFTAWLGPWLSLSICTRGRSPFGRPTAGTERIPQASFPNSEASLFPPPVCAHTGVAFAGLPPQQRTRAAAIIPSASPLGAVEKLGSPQLEFFFAIPSRCAVVLGWEDGDGLHDT